MMKVGYKLSVGSWSVDSASDPRTEFVELEARSSLDSASDCCRISVYAPPAAQPGLLEQAAGAAIEAVGLAGAGAGEEAFSVQVRGQKIKHGDMISIELTSGDATDTVCTAAVHSIQSSFGQTTIIGRSGLQGLTSARLNQVYENQSLGQIVKDLAGQVQIATGQVDIGSKYPYFVVSESRNILSQLRELAARDGLDLYFDGENKLTLKKFSKTSADHTFYFGIDIFDLQLRNQQTNTEHILVYGESPVSNKGSDTWHWIAKDLSPFQSEMGKGSKTLSIQDGVLRTKDAADSLNTHKLGEIKDCATAGWMRLLGNPKVKLGEAIEIKNAPKPELNGLFKVKLVRHILNKRDGYLTFIRFSGKGGAEKAGSLLGQAANLAGAVGL